VLQVNTADRGGGAESVAFELHRALRGQGHQSVLAVGFERSHEEGVVPLQGRGISWGLHDRLREAGLPRAARAARAIGSPGVVADLAQGREDFRFPGSARVIEMALQADVVHLHNLHGAYFDLSLLPRLTALRPTVLTLHDEWTFTGHCALTLGCDRWREVCGSCPHLDVYPRLRRDGTAFNLGRKRRIWEASRVHVVAPTRWLLDRAQASVLRHAVTGWHVVSNGIDLELFRPGDEGAARAALGLPSEAFVVLFAATGGRGNSFKDIVTLERGLALVGGTPGPDIVALAVGASGETSRLGRVELRRTGLLERTEIARHLQAADLYVHAARAEVQPLSLMEALACGLPAVASAVGGIPDVVRDGETGCLVPPGDADALAEAVQRLLDDLEGRRRMSVAAALDAHSRFSHADHVERYLQVYESAISAFEAP
jgi:glycosyltransferase involved in cell wall biosynthesis